MFVKTRSIDLLIESETDQSVCFQASLKHWNTKEEKRKWAKHVALQVVH